MPVNILPMEGAVDATELMAWEKYTPFFN